MASHGGARKPGTRGKGHHCAVEVPSSRVIVANVLGYLVLVLALKDKIRFISAFKPGTAWLVVALCVIGMVEVVAWHLADRFRGPGHAWLERSVLARIFVLPAIALGAFLWPTGKTSVLVLTVAVLLLGAARVGLFAVRVLEGRRAASRVRHRERRHAQLHAEGLLVVSLTPVAEPQLAQTTLLEDAARHLIGAALILLACLAVATNVEALETGEWKPKPTPPQEAAPKGGPTRKPKGKPHGKMTGKGPPAFSAAGAGGDAGTESSSVPSTSCEAIQPVPNIAPSTIAEVEKLFRLAGSGGPIGCPHTVKVRSTAAGPMYWSLAWDVGDPEPTAIVVIAPQEKPFVALAPAVKPIEALVLAGQRIGAEREFARYYGGQGYVYFILSETGSWLLTKEEIQTGPLVESPPSVASAVRSADKQHRWWLWPQTPSEANPGDVVYELKASAQGPVVDRVHYDPVHRTAWRGPRDKPIRYVAKQKKLPVWELQTWLPEPPSAELRLEREIEADEG